MKPSCCRLLATLGGLLGLALAGTSRAQPPASAPALPVLHMLVDNTAEMPQALMEQERLVDGIHRDVGLALAVRLGREVRFRVLPRKRLADELVAGSQADIVCGYLPDWLPGALDWSRPFLPDEQLLLTSRVAPFPRQLEELKGQRIGTVLGFVYPELQQILGSSFVRDDAPDASANLRKLAVGRVRYAVAGRLQLDYQLRLGSYQLSLYRPQVISSYQSQCALSRRSTLTLAELNKAITALQADGGLQRILAKYR
ncbi:transporter substrate-binding domain-containing protein [Pelomonas sp. SE-A7]|uniref:substrate-binding periplasmic protein n=1 Tax=Pelomonas sp. SE-A7 TaxID=3054953 RepID=UPI00259CCE14|nr:transporter substrate-binding domain-containing protein [Pelomonas sp. SE-A7]MDM4767812.1 transporter substrate-binding domain-containing protein [Pelomonas sp. SE-A7]